MTNMAIKINLMPPGERQPRWPVNRIFLGAAAVALCLLIAVAAYNQYIIWDLEARIAAAEQQANLLKPTQEKMVLANSQNQLSTAKNNLLVKLTAERKPWHGVMTHLGMVTPTQVWFTDLAVMEKNGIKLKGSSLTYADLTNFLQQLEQDEVLYEPALVKVERDQTLAVTNFEMTVKIKGMQP